MIDYLIQLYILAVGYFYPLTRYVLEEVGNGSQPPRSTRVYTDENPKPNTFRPENWTWFFATLTSFTIIDAIVSPVLSILFFPWYPFAKIAFVTALVSINDFDKNVFATLSCWIVSHSALIDSVEITTKEKLAQFWKGTWSNTSKGLFYMYQSIKNVRGVSVQKKAL